MINLARQLRFLLAAAVSALMSCQNSPLSHSQGGSGDITTNGRILGKVIGIDGEVASDVLVQMRPYDYLSDTTGIQPMDSVYRDTQTDQAGGFQVDSMGTGNFVLSLRTASRGVRFIPLLISSADTLINLQSIQLQKAVSIGGTVASDTMLPGMRTYCFVQGTEISAPVSESGTFSISGVAAASDINLKVMAFTTDTLAQADIPLKVPLQDTTLEREIVLPVTLVQDTLAVRAILDSNSLYKISVDSVAIITNGRITGLDLSDLSLKYVPDQLGTLTHLHTLNLRNNALKTLPDTIGNLTNLKRLSVGYNAISQIPSGLWRCSNLTYLEFGHNQLIDSIPHSIALLNQLDTLYFSYNYLSSLSPSIGQLSNLRSLNIDFNHIELLPDSITNCTNIEKLVVNNNKLSQLPDSLHRLNNLVTLVARNNQLSFLPEKLESIRSLERVDIGYNLFTQFPFTLQALDFISNISISFNYICNPSEELLEKYELSFQYCN